MADSDYVEFSVAQGRKYTLDHLWLQVLDEKKNDSQVKIGLSEFVRAEYGDIIRVILTKPEDDSEFKMDDPDDDEGEVSQDDDAASPMTSGDEFGVDDLLITVTTEYESKLPINAPFPCKIVSLNGDVEDNPDLVNDDAYADGWCVIVQPFDYDDDQFLDENEYIEYLNEL